MASAAVTNTFTATTAAVASEVNRNFADLVDFANDDTVHRDGTTPFTADMSMGSNKITNLAPGVAATDAVSFAQLGDSLPTGFIGMYGSASAPSAAWLLCDGAAVSRASYADLFAVIGTSFGVGDGATTFNVPDFGSRFPYGGTVGDTGGSNDAAVVAHTHTMPTHKHTMPTHTHSITHGHIADDSQEGLHTHNILTRQNYTASGSSGRPGITNSSGTDFWYSGSGGMSSGGSHNHDITVTDFTGNSAATDPGDTNLTDPGDTNSSGSSGTNANRPAFVGVNFIIKSGL